MTITLPTRLNNDPLVDALFEVRFVSKAPASVIIPGLLFQNLEGEKNITSLPIAQVPQAVRHATPEWKHAPLSRIDWDKFYINVGDSSVQINCKNPYPGWIVFKPAILKIIKMLSETGIIESVDRYSMKYIDLIPSSSLQEQVSMVNFDVTIAGHKLEKEHFQLRMDIPTESFVSIVQIASSATVKLNDKTYGVGLVFDIDTIAGRISISMEELLSQFEEKLEAVHHRNKSMFFSCLTPPTIASLKPIYD